MNVILNNFDMKKCDIKEFEKLNSLVNKKCDDSTFVDSINMIKKDCIEIINSFKSEAGNSKKKFEEEICEKINSVDRNLDKQNEEFIRNKDKFSEKCKG